MIDSMRYIRGLEVAGFSKKQSEAQLNMTIELMFEQMASKKDLNDLRNEVAYGTFVMRSEFANLKDGFGTLRGEFGDLKGEFGSLRGEFGDLKGEFGSLRGEFGDLKGEFGSLRGEFGNLKGEFGMLRGELKSEIGDIRGELGELRGEITALRSDVTSTESRLTIRLGGLMTVYFGIGLSVIALFLQHH